jgi:hypothetical protein
MASPTKHDAPHASQMKPTPGVGGAPATAGSMQPMAGHVAQTPETKGAEPHLVEGIDPVLLHRLYPDADSTADVEGLALAQGQQTWEQGATLVAAQQAPIPKTEQ